MVKLEKVPVASRDYEARLDELGTYSAIPATICAGVKLGFFTQLSGKALTPEELAERVGIGPKFADVMLTACAALGLVEKKNDRFSNSEWAEECLVEGKPRYCGDALLFHHRVFFQALGQLEVAAREDRLVANIHELRDQDPEIRRLGILSGAQGASRVNGEIMVET